VEAALSLAHCDRSLVKEVIPRFVWYSQARDFRVDACPKVEREREREREAGWLAGWLWHHGQQSLLLLLLLPSIRITVVFGSRSRPRIWKCGCRELDVGVLTSRVWIFPSSCCCVLLPFVCISSPTPLPFSFGFGFGARVWHVQMEYESVWLSFFRGEFFVSGSIA
jgi:hypothetical protein